MNNEIISYQEMCARENTFLQKGMNYRINNKYSIFLMSTSPGSPYEDTYENNGKIIIYEGHDSPKKDGINPKAIDQPEFTKNGKLTENGKFYSAAQEYKKGLRNPEIIRVYEKIQRGIWSYSGEFNLIDAWKEYKNSENRFVFKFKLKLIEDNEKKRQNSNEIPDLDHSRVIPSWVKIEVWKRDKGRCVKCGSTQNLHFDHIIPYSKGGSSLIPENIQLLCAKHNLAKRDKIE